jgi:hypothetical protein
LKRARTRPGARARSAAALTGTALATSLLAGAGCNGSGASASSDAAVACGDTQTDPHNCGACGHDCNGGACQTGSCFSLASNVLASSQHSPAGIAVDGASVYWVNRGSYSVKTGTYSGAQIMKCAKSGCSNKPTVLATGSWTDVTNLVVDSGRVYWGGSGQVFSCSTDGCSGGPAVLWAGDVGVGGLAVDDASVYFDDLDAQELHECPASGCDGGSEFSLSISAEASSGPLPPGSIGSVLAIALDDQNLYAVTSVSLGGGPGATVGTVLACSRSDCPATVHVLTVDLGEGLSPFLAVDANDVYFATTSTNTSTSSSGSVDLGGTGNGSASTLAAVSFTPTDAANAFGGTTLGDVSFPSAMAVHGGSIYVAQWGDLGGDGGLRPAGAGRITRCVVASCNGISTTVQDYVNYPQGLAVDDTSVYWTDFGAGTNPLGSDDGRVAFRSK